MTRGPNLKKNRHPLLADPHPFLPDQPFFPELTPFRGADGADALQADADHRYRQQAPIAGRSPGGLRSLVAAVCGLAFGILNSDF